MNIRIKLIIIFGLTVFGGLILGTGRAQAVVQDVTWQNAAGVSVSGNNLTKNIATGWNGAGASSVQNIPSGDGYIEFTATETTTYRLGGFNTADAIDYNINYAWYPGPGGVLWVYDHNAFLYTGSYVSGDVLRVSVESGVVKYYQNGILRFTSPTAPSYPLIFDTALYDNNSTITNAKISTNSPMPTCSSATPDGDWTIATSGTRATSVNGVANADSVLVYQWSEYNGQDDLVGYWATNQGGGTWTYNLPLDQHTELGNIFVHVYIHSAAYGYIWCNDASFVRLNNGTINVNSNMPTSWAISCPLVNPACTYIYSPLNQTSGSYPNTPYSTWVITPVDIPGYDWTVTPNNPQVFP